ncbi:MAG: CoB--CoM heterodisulfide reductase iron-sulfur subunit B family protein [Pyramidobacter sp.]|nr:CoB--CoM heterodisulfide reductase iron-sulfur subunit B family protein [Pyramidobacter sp.]
MVYNYYPGCTLSTKAKELDRAARECARVLGFPLEELQEWQCCGAVYPMAPDAVAERLSAVRALASARDRGGVLVTLCSACHHVIKRVNADMKEDSDTSRRVNTYLALEEPYRGETKVLHFLEVLRDVIGFDKLKKKVVQPLTGRKIGAYYGCMLLRPASVMAMDNVENPSILEEFLRALGAEPVIYSMRNECCAGYQAVTDKKLCERQVNRVVSNAAGRGAEELITACPLCAYNLVKNATDQKLCVRYFTELLAEALGVKGETE